MGKGKVAGRINIIDIVTVIVIIAAVFFGVSKLVLKEKGEVAVAPVSKAGGEIVDTEATATVRYRIRNIRDMALGTLVEGAVCYHMDGREVSPITNVQTENYYEYSLNNENEYAKFVHDDRFNVYFDVELPGRLTRSAFNGENWAPVGAGTVHYYSIGGISYECTVISVVPNE